MQMFKTNNRRVAFVLAIMFSVAAVQLSAITPTFLGPTPAAAQPAAAAPKLSEDQLKKLIAVMATQGTFVTADKRMTNALGLTKNNTEAIESRALTVKERDGGLIHQFQPLPEGKGYLLGNLGLTTIEAFWADKDLALVAATTSVRGGPTTGMTAGVMVMPTPVKDAQPDFDKELAYWASVADAL
jgi:hypothetical protein